MTRRIIAVLSVGLLLLQAPRVEASQLIFAGFGGGPYSTYCSAAGGTFSVVVGPGHHVVSGNWEHGGWYFEGVVPEGQEIEIGASAGWHDGDYFGSVGSASDTYTYWTDAPHCI